jgi:coenzyme PQQ synthesis protein D (PqqD)
MSDLMPCARHEDLLTEEIDGEVLVYDQRTHAGHRLNPTAAVVWRHLDGTRTVSDLVEVLAAEVGDVADEDLVMVSLDELGQAGLLEDHSEREPDDVRLSRRRFIRRVGVVGTAALVLPVVRSIVAPTAASAQASCATCNTCATCSCASCASCATCGTCTP